MGITKKDFLEDAKRHEASAEAESETWVLMAKVFGGGSDEAKSVDAARARFLAEAKRCRWLASLHSSTRGAVLRSQSNQGSGT